MAESLSFPGELAECHRLMAQQQALFAGLEQRAAEQQRQHAEQLQQQHAEQLQQQHAEQRQRYIDLEQVLDRTALDFAQLREDHQKAIDELRLLRRWIYGSRRERHVADAKQQHLFEMGQLFAEPAEEQSPIDSEIPASAEDAALAAVAQEKAARRRKKRADRKLCLDALPQFEHHHDVSKEEKVCGVCERDKKCIGEEISRGNWRFTTTI